jgi:hypothetical protein
MRWSQRGGHDPCKTRWTAKDHTWEPQKEKKGVRALIDAGVEMTTFFIKHLVKFGCVRWEELVDKAEE